MRQWILAVCMVAATTLGAQSARPRFGTEWFDRYADIGAMRDIQRDSLTGLAVFVEDVARVFGSNYNTIPYVRLNLRVAIGSSEARTILAAVPITDLASWLESVSDSLKRPFALGEERWIGELLQSPSRSAYSMMVRRTHDGEDERFTLRWISIDAMPRQHSTMVRSREQLFTFLRELGAAADVADQLSAINRSVPYPAIGAWTRREFSGQ